MRMQLGHPSVELDLNRAVQKPSETWPFFGTRGRSSAFGLWASPKLSGFGWLAVADVIWTPLHPQGRYAAAGAVAVIRFHRLNSIFGVTPRSETSCAAERHAKTPQAEARMSRISFMSVRKSQSSNIFGRMRWLHWRAAVRRGDASDALRRVFRLRHLRFPSNAWSIPVVRSRELGF